jgi:ABC-2 type transport system ATP-binding protein
MEVSVEAENVQKQFGRTQALRGVSFSYGDGITGLLGPNGAGKTTLLRILATVLSADGGNLRLLGLSPDRSEHRIAIRRQLGYLPQEPGFHQHFSVFDFVEYVAILKEMTDRISRRREVGRVLEQTSLLPVQHEKIKNLSGGMRRRVGLAQALLCDPKLLVLDEPTVGLDPEQRLRFRETVSRLGEERSVLLSTHQTEDIAALCQKVIVLHQGGVLFDGAPADLCEVARGQVWLADSRHSDARLSWRTSEGTYRNIGQPPQGAQLISPSIEDAYLLLVGSEADLEAA